jgi:predicted N-acyltransferase
VQTRFLARIDEVSAVQWNALVGDYPFLRHEFLAALENTGCADARSGWKPRHLVMTDQAGLAAAAPMYEKSHSWGEFVFDFSWARAAEQAGMNYYPKLVCAVPFTPTTGPRLLCRTGDQASSLREQLLQHMRERAESQHCSSVHALFLDSPARTACDQQQWLMRRDCHFQWHNRGYRHFDDFLSTFSADKRKKARRERRRVLEQGIEFTTLRGDELDDALIERIYAFHEITFIRHGHTPYLNVDFFTRVARAMPDKLVVKLAVRDKLPVAAAIFFRSSDTLYGRYWGSNADYHSLHFEACYYQGIDYCIEQGLERFEPGTQGEHKIARGFEPSLTWSAHWISDLSLRRAIGAYLAREGNAIDAYAHQADAHVPYRKGELTQPPQ